jgi:Flp pilus assembly protein TadD
MVLDTNGLVELNAGRVDEAVATLLEAARLAPANPTIQYRLGAAQLKAGERAAAKASLRKALDLNPAFPQAGDARALLKGL